MGEHPRVTCEFANNWETLSGQATDLSELAKGIVKCPHCKNGIQKASGCNHMKCRCGHEFCWICLQRWPHSLCTGAPKDRSSAICSRSSEIARLGASICQ